MPSRRLAPQPPVAAKRPHTTEIHGYTLKDDYFWLREKTNPEVIKHLEAENAYTEAGDEADQGAAGDALQRDARPHQADRPERAVAHRRATSTTRARKRASSIPYMCRRKGSMAGAEEILLDLNALAEGHKYLGLGAYAVSDDGNWLAYSTDTTGYRQYTLHVKDLRTGQMLAENIERVGVGRLGDRQQDAFYTTEDAVSKRSDKFWRHTRRRDDAAIWSTKRRTSCSTSAPARSRDKKVIFLGVATPRRRPRCATCRPTHRPAPLKVVLPREADHEYDVDHYNGLFYIRTNKGAKNFRVVTAPMDDPSREELEGRSSSTTRR